MGLTFRQLCLFATVCAITVLSCLAQDAAKTAGNISGSWTISIRGEGGTRTQIMSVQQDGNNLSGSIQDDRGKEALQGTITGNNIRFAISMNTPRGPMTLEYRGKLDGDSMKGTMKNPLGNSASWSARRKAQ